MPITDDQRQRRRRYLGSSDSPAVVGVAGYTDEAGKWREWKNAHDVYLEKIAEVADIGASEAIDIGNAFEAPLIAWAADQLGIEVETNVELVSQAPEHRGVLAANLDARGKGSARRVGIEAKTTSLGLEWGTEGTDEIPDRVIVQAQHQAAVAELDVVWVPVLTARFDRLERRMYRVDRDEGVIDPVVALDLNFWEDHVLPKVPPPDHLPSLDVLKRVRRIPDSFADVDRSVVNAFEFAQQARKNAELEEAEAKAALLAAMGDAEALRYGDPDWIYSYQKQSRTSIRPSDLKVAHPDLYRRLSRVSTYRVLRRKKAR